MSIAMASYNGEAYLQEQLDSFVKQTRLPDEVVISDDGSTDGTVEILEAFQSSAPFEVRVLRNKNNLGYAGNFNRALYASRGDFVFLSDQDDWWHPKKIQIILQRADENRWASVIFNDARLADSNLRPSARTLLSDKKSDKRLNPIQLGACIGLRREFIKFVLPIPKTSFGHDGWIAALSNMFGETLTEPTVLQYWRRHDAATSALRLNNKIGRRYRLVAREINGCHLSLLTKRSELLRGRLVRVFNESLSKERRDVISENLVQLDTRIDLLRLRSRFRELPRKQRLLELPEYFRKLRNQSNYGGLRAFIDLIGT